MKSSNLTKEFKLKGRVRFLPMVFLLLGALLIVVDVFLFTGFGFSAGLPVAIFALIYFLVLLLVLLSLRSLVLSEMVSFAAEYGQVQRILLRELDIPYAVLDAEGVILWCNTALERLTETKKDAREALVSLFPEITAQIFPVSEGEDVELPVRYKDFNYRAKLRRIELQHMVSHSDLFEVDEEYGALYAFYLYDETALQLALREVDDQSLVAGLIYMDNYDEAMETVEEVRRSLLTALIDRKVNRYIASCDGICRKIEKDKYFVIMTKKACQGLIENRFDVLEDVKTVSIGNEMAMTLSIGIGYGGLSYAQNYEFARNAIDLALGRGGDQAVVKTPQEVGYYGGKSQKAERNTRVKARVKAHALQEMITASDTVIVMGHRLGDVDSFGACVGIYRITKALGRKCHILMNDVTTSTRPLIELFRDNPDYEADMILTSQEALSKVTDATTVVVVDVNRPSITDCPELLHETRSIVVLDHHRAGTEVIENATLSYVEPYASSTSEMVSEIMQYIGDTVKIPPLEANCLYSGIMIDTNNFVQKTGVRTFEAAAYLRRSGADVTVVRKLFREDADEYRAKADAVSQAEIYRGSFAISACQGEGITSPTIVGAQAANELLNIKGIKASFICTEFQNKIFVSARSIDEVNVQIIMEKLGGGGHLNIAGCQMENISVTEAIAVIKRTLDEMIENGDLEA
ncbi:MAG: DHH family phosphoesterase [Lachnospiraceae bacterium]|nr:DHH family phosphoesterase [Lachnospiraceae bacterium]